ncbi:MAG: c-type cytochrome [Candidatus Xenobia bacterium]
MRRFTARLTLTGLALGALLVVGGCEDKAFENTQTYIAPSPAYTPIAGADRPSQFATPAPTPPNREFMPAPEQLPDWTKDHDLKNPVPDDQASLSRGKDAYDANCALCHGNNGDGNGTNAPVMTTPPRVFTQGIFLYGDSDGEIYRTIDQGIPGTGMVAWHDTLYDDTNKPADQTIWDLVNYVKSFSMK